MEDMPSELIFNWYQTGISIVLGSFWTMDVKGAKYVEISGTWGQEAGTSYLPS